jgi:hypothetical protein
MSLGTVGIDEILKLHQKNPQRSSLRVDNAAEPRRQCTKSMKPLTTGARPTLITDS